MKGIGIVSLAFIIVTGTVSVACAAGPSDERVRSAYGLILSETDANKDGKLSVSECKAIYKDPAMADKNCKFWDADSDGIITENEYVGQVMSLGKKK